MCDGKFPFLWDFDWHKIKLDLDIKSQQMFEIKKNAANLICDCIPPHFFKQFCLKYVLALPILFKVWNCSTKSKLAHKFSQMSH